MYARKRTIYADIQTTMNRYAHRRMDKIEEAKESLKTMYM